MQITVLGKSPAWQDADGACSGYLVEDGGRSLLLDCGHGVFAKLRRFRDYLDVEAVVISHLHADHFLDLIPFSYALMYAPRRGPERTRPRLYAPAGAAATFRRLTGAWGKEDLVESAFDLHEYDAPDELSIGPFSVRFCRVPHYTPTYAVELSTNGGERLTYSADCRPNEELVRFASGTDLLLIEGTLARPEGDGERGHLTPGEAGDHGRRAGARRLVLTHFSDLMDSRWALEQASAAFGEGVELAREGAVYSL